MLFFGIQGFAQLKTDAQSIFKMLLFLDKENSYVKGMDVNVSKNDSLYKSFSDILYLKLRKLENIENNFQYGLGIPKYDFYELLVYDNAKGSYTNNVIYKRKLRDNEGQLFGIALGGCDSYIIAINQTTGTSYRLKGFRANDFLAFLFDFKENYNSENREKLTTKSFLIGYKIEDLDFECLYGGLTAKEMDRKKFPCLKRVADIVPVSN